MTRIRNALLVLGALLLALALVAACGGDDDDAGGDDTGDEVTATADAGDETQPAGETDAPDDGGDPTDGGNGGGDAPDLSGLCSVLSKDEVEDAFGVSMLDPELIPLPDIPISGGNASVASCSYVASETSESMSFSVTSSSGNDSGISAMIDLACQNKEEISGLGDKACWYSEAHTEIQMKIGATFVDLFITTVEGDSTAIATGLAEKIADRL